MAPGMEEVDVPSNIDGLGTSSTFDAIDSLSTFEEPSLLSSVDGFDLPSAFDTLDELPDFDESKLPSSVDGFETLSTFDTIDSWSDSKGLGTTTLLDGVDSFSASEGIGTAPSIGSDAVERSVSQPSTPQTRASSTTADVESAEIASDIDSFIRQFHAEYSFQRTYSALVAYGDSIDNRVLYFVAAQLLNTGSAAIAGSPGLAVSFIGSALAIYAFIDSGDEENE